MAVDVAKIRELFDFNFAHTGEMTIDPQTGLVSCTGNVNAKKQMKRFPVSFDQVKGSFSCSRNQLTSLKGAPGSVGGGFFCHNNQLTSLEGAPGLIGGDFYCHNNQLTSLVGAPGSISGKWFMTVHPDVPLLNLLHVKKIDGFILDSGGARLHDLEEILMRYRGTGYNGMAPCAARMAKLGYGSNARMG